MITSKNVISRLIKFQKRPIPEEYFPFRHELMGLIQDGKIPIDTPKLILCLLEVDCRMRSYQPSPDVTLCVTLSESSIERIRTGHIHLNEIEAAEAIIEISKWYYFMLADHSAPMDFVLGGYDEAERIAEIETGLFAQELTLLDWLSKKEFLETWDKKYAPGIRFGSTMVTSGMYLMQFSYYATTIFRSCISVDAGKIRHLANLLDSQYLFDVISQFRQDFSGLLGSEHATEFFALRKLIDQHYDLPKIDKHRSEAFAVRHLDWMITYYRPELAHELSARPQLPVWTDEDTFRTYAT